MTRMAPRAFRRGLAALFIFALTTSLWIPARSGAAPGPDDAPPPARSAAQIQPEIDAAHQQLAALFPTHEDWFDQAKRDAGAPGAIAAIRKLLVLYPELTRSPEVEGAAELAEGDRFVLASRLAVLGDKETVDVIEAWAKDDQADTAAVGQSLKLAARWYRAGADPNARKKVVAELDEMAARFDSFQRDPLQNALALVALTTRPQETNLRDELRRIVKAHFDIEPKYLEEKFDETDKRLAAGGKDVTPASQAMPAARRDRRDVTPRVVNIPPNPAAALIRQESHLVEFQLMRQALAEMTPQDPVKKKQAEALLAKVEADLKEIVAEADRDPKSTAALRPRLQKVHEAAQKDLRPLFSDAQFDALGERVHQMTMQAAFLCSASDEVVRMFSKFNLTPRQTEQIKNFVAEEAAEMRKSAAPGNAAEMVAAMDRLGPAYLAARKKLKATLTPDQFKRFDTGFNQDRPN